jgi:phospholipid/cholesterol/gamma-HCH transport system substrate-binding protein
MHHSHKMTIGAVGFVLLGVGSLIFLVTQIGKGGVSLTPHAMYAVTAKFDNIGDLKAGARVSMAGVEIGRVMRIDFDATEQRAVVSMRLNAEFNRIPNDSSASINTQGILGGKFVSLTNGGSEIYLKNNDRISQTRSATSLENVISQLLTHYLQAKSGSASGTDP